MTKAVKIKWGGGEVSGRIAGAGSTGILLAHGAGTDQDHAFMVLLRDQIAETGLQVMTFNYPYSERGSKRPDRAEKLVECHQGAADYLSARVERLFLAGRSMGGRMGTYLIAEGYDCAGAVLYAYPLHPAGKPDKLRIAHFPDVQVPMLFFQGTRDTLSRMELFDRHIRPLPNADVVLVEGASHATRGGGWTQESLSAFLAAETATWIGALSSGTSSA